MPKNKFLFLANRDIGNCHMTLRRYEEAEQRFKRIMEFLPIWPGTDDSDYPINFRQIATAQMAQQLWEAAEDSLNKSVSLFDPQIQKALSSDNEFSRTEHAGNLLGSKARSLAYLGVVYLREGRTAEALKTAELAYNEATQPHVPSKALIALVDNLKDPRVVPLLGPSLSSGNGQIRYLALSGLNTIANAEACSTVHHANDDEAAFERETASCKAWGNEKGNIDRGPAISKPPSTQF